MESTECRVYFETNAVAARDSARQRGCSCANERIQDGIAFRGVHLDKTERDLERESAATLPDLGSLRACLAPLSSRKSLNHLFRSSQK